MESNNLINILLWINFIALNSLLKPLKKNKNKIEININKIIKNHDDDPKLLIKFGKANNVIG